MSLFGKKEKVILRSEEQKDAFIEKLDSANIKYDIREDKENSTPGHIAYMVRVDAKDMQKVV
jgi:hypothetical protein